MRLTGGHTCRPVWNETRDRKRFLHTLIAAGVMVVFATVGAFPFRVEISWILPIASRRLAKLRQESSKSFARQMKHGSRPIEKKKLATLRLPFRIG